MVFLPEYAAYMPVLYRGIDLCAGNSPGPLPGHRVQVKIFCFFCCGGVRLDHEDAPVPAVGNRRRIVRQAAFCGSVQEAGRLRCWDVAATNTGSFAVCIQEEKNDASRP